MRKTSHWQVIDLASHRVAFAALSHLACEEFMDRHWNTCYYVRPCHG